MAFYISIEKTAEDETSAKYRFVAEGGKSGLFQIEKEGGEVTLLEQMPGDENSNFFNRAAVKIMKAWKAGALPAKAEWAS